eukprot:CAMPEP_0176476432 /NCGR_PEP_ID=MMETSP0200_2-20121128/47_1 /TAXON_ID=947934 /ORGANISM="Chaetoceros sp., Strain GSL56" /LENGTH=966 /DNA_ID=CAMNT_0017872097 /DNA_START=322 /DNA_END=3221 /DNA_ORIENTATION=-
MEMVNSGDGNIIEEAVLTAGQTDKKECSAEYMNIHQNDDHGHEEKKKSKQQTEKTLQLLDEIDDSFYHPLHSDPSCSDDVDQQKHGESCWSPPQSTVETEQIMIAATALYGGKDPSDESQAAGNTDSQQENDKNNNNNNHERTTVTVDKHWGTDETILKMRDKLRNMGRGKGTGTATASNPHENKRPPIFLMPGLASTRLVSWKYKVCSNPLLSDVKVQDYVWMNLNMLLQMATLDDSCFLECMTLGLNQTDANDVESGCKLRPDEGLDAISSLAPDSIGTNVLVGGKNTVYAWLTQWLADNLGYDVSSIVGLPYDWRLSPDVMEARDGFLTLTRKRIEAAVATNGGEPGIMVAHSMGNNVFRYFLEWLKNKMHEEAYARLIKQVNRREMAMRSYHSQSKQESNSHYNNNNNGPTGPGWVYSQAIVRNKEAAVEYSVTDQMFKLANSFVTSLDDMWQSYVGGIDPKSQQQQQRQQQQQKDDGSDEQQQKQQQVGDKVSMQGKGDDWGASTQKHSQLWELAQAEGDDEWLEWINKHIWTYIGLSAPLLGAINPLRAVISGENMGMPLTEKNARNMEITFGSTHTLNPISTSTGFCDHLNDIFTSRNNLACLEELIDGIEKAGGNDPWRNFPTLKAILKDRVDWDTDFAPVSVNFEECSRSQKPPCKTKRQTTFTAKDVQSGELFAQFNDIWKEQGNPLKIKREQLEKSWWHHPFPNLLNTTWDRPHIKHVIMSYGVDYPTEVGYIYKKVDFVEHNEKNDTMPLLQSVIWEEGNNHFEEVRVSEQNFLKDSVLLMKKTKRRPLREGNYKTSLHRSGDASVPYLSLAWSHTWLLHATRAMRHSRYYGMQEGDRISDDNALNSIKVSYRPAGGSAWIEGGKPKVLNDMNVQSNTIDDQSRGSDHPHGTKYKPEMYRYQSKGKSRKTGMEYTTAIIEAVGVEHKETTRNYDILAAVFTDVLKNMHDDFGLV